MQGKYSAVLGSVILMLIFSHAANAYELTCPPSVKVQPPKVKASDHPGWQMSSRWVELSLDGAVLVSGPPEGLADLRPDTVTEKGQLLSLWSVDNPVDRERGIWLACSYAKQYVVLAKKIEQPVTECRISIELTQPYTLHCQ